MMESIPPNLSEAWSSMGSKELKKPIDTIQEKEKLVPAFLATKGLVKQHIASFNQFIEEGIKNIISANNKVTSSIDPYFYLKYTDVRVGSPNLIDTQEGCEQSTYPQECRLRDLTYAAPIFVDVEYIKKKTTTLRKQVEIGRMPIMLRSSKCILSECQSDAEFAAYLECPLDPGGYFVIRGTEKVILMQEQLSKNRMIVEKDKKGVISCQVTSSTHEKKVRTNLLAKNGVYYLRHNSFTEDIPVTIIFKGMGFTSEREIMSMISTSEYAQNEFHETILQCHKQNILTETQALQYIGEHINQKRNLFRSGPKKMPLDEARDLLGTVILAHIPVHDFNFKSKAVYLACMVRRVIDAQQDEKVLDDRDYYGNKRIELAGSLISLLFEDAFKRMNVDLKMRIDKSLSAKNVCPPDAVLLLSSMKNMITSTLDSTISSGNWNIKRFKMERSSVTQVLSRLSYISALGMMTRVNSQFEKTRKVSGPRSVQGSQWGIICPSDTPEGESCGLVKNLALMAHITTEIDPERLISICYKVGVEALDPFLHGEDFSAPGVYVVFINGRNIGVTVLPMRVVNIFKKLRRKGLIDSFVSIYADHKHRNVHISSDGGRLCRPYIIVQNGSSLVTKEHIELLKKRLMVFEDFIDKGLIEYLDVNELNDCFVAMYERDIKPYTTHLEIEPYTILGVCAGLIPYPHHNQSPRNTYQCAMGKQAMGSLGYNQGTRIDTLGYHLVYPQKPLIKTKTIEMIGFENLPAGHNAIVAVLSFSGYDIEDAVILNKASLDRGYGRCIVYKNSKVQLKMHQNDEKDRVMGPKTVRKEGMPDKVLWKYSALDMDGLPHVGTKMMPGQVMVNKETPTMSHVNEAPMDIPRAPLRTTAPVTKTFKETPLCHRGNLSCHVEKVMVTVDTENTTLFKLLLREVRRPEVGDKFSSRHGQKGVTGLIVNQEDMPFTEYGMQPDMVMNPHGFPSRMTLGKQLEFLGSKASAIEGKMSYGTAFGGTPMEEYTEFLTKRGFHYQGKDILHSGHSGEPLNCYIYFGPVYYQKLKHMVGDKMHARSIGPRSVLTRQPTEGRAKEGGLRLGEMERDCLVAHGCSMLIVERLLLSSDDYIADICSECGYQGYLGWCRFCRSSRNVCKIRMPYAFKLLLQELMSMNIRPRLKLKSYLDN